MHFEYVVEVVVGYVVEVLEFVVGIVGVDECAEHGSLAT